MANIMIVITLPLLWRCLAVALAKANARPLEPRERGGTRVRASVVPEENASWLG